MPREREAEADFYVVIGGDGTLLTAFKTFVRTDIPIIAINAGQLGFLTEIKKRTCFKNIRIFWMENFNLKSDIFKSEYWREDI